MSSFQLWARLHNTFIVVFVSINRCFSFSFILCLILSFFPLFISIIQTTTELKELPDLKLHSFTVSISYWCHILSILNAKHDLKHVSIAKKKNFKNFSETHSDREEKTSLDFSTPKNFHNAFVFIFSCVAFEKNLRLKYFRNVYSSDEWHFWWKSYRVTIESPTIDRQKKKLNF